MCIRDSCNCHGYSYPMQVLAFFRQADFAFFQEFEDFPYLRLSRQKGREYSCLLYTSSVYAKAKAGRFCNGYAHFLSCSLIFLISCITITGNPKHRFAKRVIHFGDPITPQQLGLTPDGDRRQLKNATNMIMDEIKKMRDVYKRQKYGCKICHRAWL